VLNFECETEKSDGGAETRPKFLYTSYAPTGLFVANVFPRLAPWAIVLRRYAAAAMSVSTCCERSGISWPSRPSRLASWRPTRAAPLMNALTSGEAMVVQLPDQRLIAIQPLDPS